MGTPTKKRTSGQRKRRGSHFALKAKRLVKCPKCKKEVLPHHACRFCGHYKKRKVLKTASSPKKTSKKD